MSRPRCTSANNVVGIATVYAAPVAQTPSVPTSLCANSTGNSAAVPADGETHVWTITTGGVTTTQTGDSITFDAGGPGNAVITVTEINPVGDSASTTVSIPIVALPSALAVTFPADGTTVTAGSVITLEASSSDASVLLLWQVSSDGGANYATIRPPVAAPNFAYTLDTTGMTGTFLYRVQFLSKCGTVESQPITLTITSGGG